MLFHSRLLYLELVESAIMCAPSTLRNVFVYSAPPRPSMLFSLLCEHATVQHDVVSKNGC